MEKTSTGPTEPKKLGAKTKKKLKFNLSCARYAYKKAIKRQCKAITEIERQRWFSVVQKGYKKEDLDLIRLATFKGQLVQMILHPNELIRKYAKARFDALDCLQKIEELRIELYGR